MKNSFIELDKDKNALQIVHILKTNGFQAYYVGGCVRDALLGHLPHDIDICTNALPEQVIKLLHLHYIPALEVGAKFGTVVGIIDKTQYEITTFRCDGQYSDSRRPDGVTFVSSLEEDLSRRDFTINAIAYDPYSCKLVDPFDGQSDISSGLIRCVGDPNDRFREDALRILRALRFAIRYGFSIDDATAESIHANKELLNNISKERITQEFEKTFSYNKPIKKVFGKFCDVIATIIPEIEPCIGFDQKNKYHKHDVYEHMLCVCDSCDTSDFNTKLAALLHDIGKPDCYTEDEEGNGHFYGHPVRCAEITKEVLSKRFRLSNRDYEEVIRLIGYHDLRPTNTDRSCRKLIIRITEPSISKWFILKNADITDHVGVAEYYKDLSEIEERVYKLLNEENCFKIKDLKVSGKDVMKVLRINSGPEVGKVLKKLFDMVIDGEVENDRERLIELIETVTI